MASMFRFGGRALAATAATIIFCTPATAAAGSAFAERMVQVGPELLGEQVVWGEQTRDGLAVAWWSGKQLRRTKLLDLPQGRGVQHRFRDMAGSSGRIAFIRSTRTVLANRTDIAVPPPPPAAHADALLVGQLDGPYRVIARAHRRDNSDSGRCGAGSWRLNEVEMAHHAIALLESARVCKGGTPRIRYRVVLFRRHSGRTTSKVLARMPARRPDREGPAISDLRTAGPFVAWVRAQREDGGDHQAACVYDRRVGAVVYCLRAPRPNLEDILEWVALQADGKLVIGSGAYHDVVWASTRDPRPHRIGSTFVNGFGPVTVDVGFARNLVAFNRQGTADRPNDLAVADLRGHAVSIFVPKAGQTLGGLDFDGRRIAWAVFDRDSLHGTLHLRSVRRPSAD